MQKQPSLLLNGEVIWQASDSSLTKELHDYYTTWQTLPTAKVTTKTLATTMHWRKYIFGKTFARKQHYFSKTLGIMHHNVGKTLGIMQRNLGKTLAIIQYNIGETPSRKHLNICKQFWIGKIIVPFLWVKQTKQNTTGKIS